jgi:hypothetical protein
LESRQIERFGLLKVIEDGLERYAEVDNSHACLVRTICEVAHTPVSGDGLLVRFKNIWHFSGVHFFRGKSLSAENSAEFLGKFRGISWKNDFSKLFPRKIPFFHNIFGGKFSAENSAEFSPEKMYEKSAPGILIGKYVHETEDRGFESRQCVSKVFRITMLLF